ncbi:hypothetical protein QEH42_gp135 [Microbacterium phage Pumpernickel]|uniref:Uncharacterized protein n=1 Tax=Microbacterium phage Pumpernickel TaxID=2885983 RepID=A0AAE9C2N1_9CAUD|nr:hypothetical protein QEH42_gp032 [Microbacterium phage Pumpernickel]YP_010755323.1 hypothetical protein QEH42_gp135 [Microbacterium phage Pumpernickel]UDL15823.1 hypothetical protein SEA_PUMPERNICKEL_32 [Microbacterium phage Pumpernickel]UDL16083.1 hypothetical protein SEA_PUMPERNICKEL_333 [Microbacterium phage Pumpernickel]
MPTQYVSPQDMKQVDQVVAQCAALMIGRNNPEVRFDPAAHLIEFEFGTKRTVIVVMLDEMTPFDRLITEQNFVENFEPKIV